MADSDAESIMTNPFAQITTEEELQRRIESRGARDNDIWGMLSDSEGAEEKKRAEKEEHLKRRKERRRKRKSMRKLKRDLGPHQASFGLRRGADGRILGSLRISKIRGENR
jgi:hypothetical protein